MSIESKEEALDVLEQARSEYLIEARSVAHKLAKERVIITIDDVRSACPPPADINPKVMGAVFNTRDWQTAGFCATARKEAHGRPIRKWRLSNG